MNTNFWRAAREGDEEEVRRLALATNIDVNVVDVGGGVPHGWNVLHYAASLGQGGVVRLLLSELGAEIEHKTNNGGWTALHIATRLDHTGIVKLLYDLGANLEATTTNRGWTPLHIAAAFENNNNVRLLHSLGANFYARDYADRTPRFWSSCYIVDLLDTLHNSPAMRRINILARPRPPAIGGEIYIDTIESGGVAAYWRQCCGVTSGDIVHILSFLDNSRDYAQARLVCKTWRRIADTTLENRGEEFFKVCK